MNNLRQKSNSLRLRKLRVRAKISGTTERPRLTISVSNLHVSAQIINDTTHSTIVGVSTVGKKFKDDTKSLTAKATWVGNEIAKKASAKKITKVAFDRNGMQYHGRVKALAEAARAAGLEF